jgi:hypothetical protein
LGSVDEKQKIGNRESRVSAQFGETGREANALAHRDDALVFSSQLTNSDVGRRGALGAAEVVAERGGPAVRGRIELDDGAVGGCLAEAQRGHKEGDEVVLVEVAGETKVGIKDCACYSPGGEDGKRIDILRWNGHCGSEKDGVGLEHGSDVARGQQSARERPEGHIEEDPRAEEHRAGLGCEGDVDA